MHLYDRKVREQRALVDYATGKWSSRPDRAVWVRDLIRECKEAGLAVFFKQRLVRRGMWEPIYVPAASASTVSARVRRTSCNVSPRLDQSAHAKRTNIGAPPRAQLASSEGKRIYCLSARKKK